MPARARSHLGLPIVLLWTAEDSELSRSAFAPPGAGVWSPSNVWLPLVNRPVLRSRVGRCSFF